MTLFSILILINEDIITNNLYEAIKICQIDIKILFNHILNDV